MKFFLRRRWIFDGADSLLFGSMTDYCVLYFIPNARYRYKVIYRGRSEAEMAVNEDK